MNKTIVFLAFCSLLACGTAGSDLDPGLETGGSGGQIDHQQAAGGDEQAGSGGQIVENQAGMAGFSAGAGGEMGGSGGLAGAETGGSGPPAGGSAGNQGGAGGLAGGGAGGSGPAGGTGGAAPLICDAWKAYQVGPTKTITIKGGAFWTWPAGQPGAPGPLACSLDPWSPKNPVGLQTSLCYQNQTSTTDRIWFMPGPGSKATVTISALGCP